MELIEGYRIVKSLGRGPFGKVFLTEKLGKKYAIKQIPRQLIFQNHEFQQYIDEQLQCMMKINSPHIMKVKEKFQDELNIYLIFQYCDGGNLITYQSKLPNQVFTLKKALKAISQIITGLLELHSYQLLYKDIKPQNILVEIKPNNIEIFKLADFGFEGNQTLPKRMMNGSVNFLAPERLTEQTFQKPQLGFAVDIWSIGVLLYFMLNMEYPFRLTDNQIQNLATVERKCTPAFSYQQSVVNTSRKLSINSTPEVEELFESIFRMNPQQRITFHEIKQNDLLKQFFNDNKMIQKSKIVYKKEFESKIKSKIQSKIIKNGLFRFGQASKDTVRVENGLKLPNLIEIIKESQEIEKFKKLPSTVEIKESLEIEKFEKLPSTIEIKESLDEFDNDLKLPSSLEMKESLINKKQGTYSKIKEEQQEYLESLLPSSLLNPHSSLIPPSRHIIHVYPIDRQFSIISSKIQSEQYQLQLKVYTFQKERNELLLSISESYLEPIKYFLPPLKYSLRYYSLKLYIIYTRNLKKFYQQKKIPQERPNLNWANFFQSEDYKALLRQVTDKLKEEQTKFQMFHKQCESHLDLIQSKIKGFRNGFNLKIIQTQFEGVFKHSYRKITSLSYAIISKLLKKKDKINSITSGEIQKLYFMMINIFICHCFNRIFIKSQLKSTFPMYFDWLAQKKLNNKGQFSFDTFRIWLKVQNRENLKKTTQEIIKKYFKK